MVESTVQRLDKGLWSNSPETFLRRLKADKTSTDFHQPIMAKKPEKVHYALSSKTRCFADCVFDLSVES